MPKVKPEWKRHQIPGSILFAIDYSQVEGKQWERVVRPPGVRVVCLSDDSEKIILQSEYRREMKRWDWRLPGGKVFDDLSEMDKYLEDGGKIEDAAANQAVNEAQEEAGIKIKSPKLNAVIPMTATIVRDLYFFTTTNWKISGNHDREHGEEVGDVKQFSKKEVLQMIKDGELNEPPTVTYLMQNFV